MPRPGVAIWSPTRAEALTAAARAAGFDPDAGRGAAIMVVDAAGADAQVPAQIDAASGRPVVLVVTDTAAPVALDAWIDAGATQVATVGADGTGFAQALRLAARAAGERPARRERRGGSGGRTAEPWLEAKLATGGAWTVIHVALLRVDLVNAAYGRRAGTRLVSAAQRRITAQLGALDDSGGLVGRAPGPALIAALAGPPEQAILAAARIEEALARPFPLDGRPAMVGARIGIAGAREGEGAAALLARAAANTGEDAVAQHVSRAADSLGDSLAVDVHHAIARGEVSLRFQPQAAIGTGEIVGVEALARWEHPWHGALGAPLLFAAAAEAGLGLALSEQVQRSALAAAAAWPPTLDALGLSINLTAADLARPRFAETLLDTVDASGFPRGRLTLEITESELIADLDAAALLLAELRGAGCRIAIDDFGTGYSSLAYLKALPVDYLKLDRALAQDIAGSERDQVVVRGAIAMARSLGLQVIAEGVETEEQRALLGAAGCGAYQGFLLAEPLEGEALVRMVEGER